MDRAAKKVVLKKFVEIFYVDDKKVLVDVAGCQFSIAGDIMTLLLKDFFEFIRQERTRAEIFERFSGSATEKELDEMILDLAKVGILAEYSDEQCREFSDGSDVLKNRYLSFFESNMNVARKEPIESYRNLRESTVLVIGSAAERSFIVDHFQGMLPYPLLFLDRDAHLSTELEKHLAGTKPNLVVSISGPFQFEQNKMINGLCYQHSVKALFFGIELVWLLYRPNSYTGRDRML